jgi:hypothetical protein
VSNVAQIRGSTVAFIINDNVAKEFDEKIPDVSQFTPHVKDYQSKTIEPSPTQGISEPNKDFANSLVSTTIQQLAKVAGGNFKVHAESEDIKLSHSIVNVDGSITRKI